MSNRRQFLQAAVAIPLAQDSTIDQPKKFHVTLYSGGVAVGEWDTLNWSGGDNSCFFTDSKGNQLIISGTYSVEEQ